MSEIPNRHPEFDLEQAYIAFAHDCLERMRQTSENLPAGGGDPKARAALGRMRDAAVERFNEAELSICFGRLDFVRDDTLYLGRHGIFDGSRTVVVNWRADAAKPFYSASPADPMGVTRRRRFEVEGRDLLSLSDEYLAQQPDVAEAPAAPIDSLLSALERNRTAQMRDIVATIQRDQYRLISQPLERTMVVQGGPGTGKTAVGLHRAAWLLYHYMNNLQTRGVLVVGPNRVFMQYVEQVLPSLGETSVDQRSIHRLHAVEPTTLDDPLVQRLKARPEMADVVLRAAIERVRPPVEDVDVDIDGAKFTLEKERILSLMPAVDPTRQPYNAARTTFRERLAPYFRERYAAAASARVVYTPARAGEGTRVGAEINRVVDRIWPSFTAPELVRQLLASAERLAAASEGILSDTEQRLLYRKPVARTEDVRWTTSDIPLIDEAEELLAGPPPQYSHVIVDESQDLTPMELRMVRRRAKDGSFTFLGDIAQATGIVQYPSWSEVLGHADLDNAPVEELVHAYRVPREIMDVALPLLPLIAPDVQVPIAYRSGGDESLRFASSSRPSLAEVVAGEVAPNGSGTSAIIAPQSYLPEIRTALDLAGVGFSDATRGQIGEGVELLTPRLAKGLEFDRVVLVEPAAIVYEGLDGQGQRELYVALTRATQMLTCVHSQPLPWPLADAPPATGPGKTVVPSVPVARGEKAADSAVAPMEAMELSLTDAWASVQLAGADIHDALWKAVLILELGGTVEEVAAAILRGRSVSSAIESRVAEITTASSAVATADRIQSDVVRIVHELLDPNGNAKERDH